MAGTEPSPGDRQGIADSRAALWTSIWALVILFQLVSTAFWFIELRQGTAVGIAEAVLFLLAIALLMRPHDVRLLGAVAVAQIGDTALNLPYVPNHRFFTSIVEVALLSALGIAFGVWKSTGKKESLLVLTLERFEPIGRSLLVVLYFFAVFHKLNSGFFNPMSSCASEFYLHVTNIYAGLPTDGWVFLIMPYGVVVVEALIPILLVVRRTRHWGLLLLMLFHFALAMDEKKHFFDFSSTVYGLAALYLPWDVTRRLSDGTKRFLSRFKSTRTPERLGATMRHVLAVAFVVIAGSGIGYGRPALMHVFFLGRQTLWNLVSLAAMVIFVRGVGMRASERDTLRPLHGAPRGLYAIVALAFVNGMSPYLGLKTRSAFDMYSNLRISGPREPNHYVWGRTWNLSGEQEALVEILWTDDASLAKLHDDGYLITRFELRRRLVENPSAHVVVRDGEREVRLPDASNEPAYAPPSFWAQKLLWFRPVDATPISRCQW